MPKIVFMGTPDFAEISLETLYNANFEIIRSCDESR